MTFARPIESPCVRVCAIEARSGLCLGCKRSLKEIANWAAFSDEDRAAIIDDLPRRRLAADGPRPA